MADESGRRHHAPGLEEPGEPFRPASIAKRVVVHDHAAAGRRDQSVQVLDATRDGGFAQLVLDVGRRARQVDQRRPLAGQVRRRHRRERPLHVGGEDEALALGVIDDGEGEDEAQRRPFHAVRQRRRYFECEAHLLLHGPVGARDLGARREHGSQIERALGLSPLDHAARVFQQDAPTGVGDRLTAEVIVVIVADEDDGRPLRVRGDAVVGAAQLLPLLVGRREVEA